MQLDVAFNNVIYQILDALTTGYGLTNLTRTNLILELVFNYEDILLMKQCTNVS